MQIVVTIYGDIAIKEENGVKKCDFEKSNFINTQSLYSFLKDLTLLKKLFNY